MLVRFSFNNYKCFPNETVLSLVAGNSVVGKDYYSIPTTHRYSVLKCAAVYGANGSGKTKLFEALNFMKQIVCPPLRDVKTPIADFWLSRYDNFRLNTHFTNKESSFEVIFVLNEVQYRYGLEVNNSQILSEWLYAKQKREICIFERDIECRVDFNAKHINQAIANNLITAQMVSKTTPFISLLSTFNDPLAKDIVNWFSKITIISANEMNMTDTFQAIDLQQPITEFMQAFDFNIEDFKLHEISIDELPDKISKMFSHAPNTKIVDGVLTYHKVFNENYERIDTTAFRMEKDESFGTNRLFALSGSIFKALVDGSVLFIDEIDSGLHTNIVRFIISMFYKSNNRSQLIVNTQNSTLLDVKDIYDEYKLFRKDQLYIASKNRYGEAKLYSINEYKLRSKIESDYLDGSLGGVPNLITSNYDKLLRKTPNE